MDALFKHWSDKGLSAIKDLYIDNHVASLPSVLLVNLFRYLLIKHFVKECFPRLDTITKQHVFYDSLTKAPTSKHLTSQLVNLFSMATSLQIKEVVSYSRELAPDRLSVILGCSYASLILSSALQQAHVWCGHRKKGHFKKMEVKLPSLSKKWLNCMVSCLHLQEIPYTVSSSSTKFKKIWGLFIEHIRREWPKGGNWLCFIYFFLYICVFLYVAVVHCTVLVFYLHLGLWYPNYSRPALIPFGPGLLVFIFFILYLFFISGHSWASC